MVLGEPNYYISHIVESLCIIGPNVFVAISAYFMVDTNKIQVRKIVNLYIQMVFWALLFYLFTVVVGVNPFSLKETILVFAPFLNGRRWFVETYILLLLFAPFINVLIRRLEQRSLLLLIGIWALIYTVWPSFLASAPNTDNGYGLANFITIYLIIGFIKSYVDEGALQRKRKLLLIIWVGSSLIAVVMSIVPALINNSDGIISAFCNRAWDYDFAFNITASISLFLTFKTIKMQPSKIINMISASTFGIFLIHSDFSLWTLLYQGILHCNRFYHSTYFAVHMIFSVAIMFICSLLLEIVRKKVWSKTIDKLLNNDVFAKWEVEVN